MSVTSSFFHKNTLTGLSEMFTVLVATVYYVLPVHLLRKLE